MDTTFISGSRPLARPSVPISLVYGSCACLSLDVVSAEGTPVDVGDMGLDRWTFSLTAGQGTPELASAVIPENVATGSRIDVTLDLNSAELFRAVTGTGDGVRCLLCVYGRHDGEDVDAFAMHLPVTVESRCCRHAPVDLSTALMRELQQGAAEGRALSRQVATAIVELSEIRADTEAIAATAAENAVDAVREKLSGTAARAEIAAERASESADSAAASASRASEQALQAAARSADACASAAAAKTSSDAALEAMTAARASEEAAARSSEEASARAGEAVSAASRAEAAALEATTATGSAALQVDRALEAADAASAAAATATEAASQAQTHAVAATASAESASASADTAKAAREGAALSERSAEAAADLAGNHATAAEEAATGASASASEAASSATSAGTAADSASTSASSAAGHAATAAADVTAQFADALGSVSGSVTLAQTAAESARASAEQAAEAVADTYGRETVDAMVGAGLEVSFSADGEEWHSAQAEEDALMRVRSLGVADAAWSSPIRLPRGPQGVPGATGVSPLVKVEQSGGDTVITVTDRDGVTTSTIEGGLSREDAEALVSRVLRYMGTVATYAELPTEGQAVGDVWNVAEEDEAHWIKAGDNVAWTGTEWDVLAGAIDTSAFALKAEAATDHDHDETYLKLTGGTVTGELTVNGTVRVPGPFYAGSVNATNNITEKGNQLADKYAAKDHNHDASYLRTGLADASWQILGGGLQSTGWLETKSCLKVAGDANVSGEVLEHDQPLRSQYVMAVDTLPEAAETSPACVVVTGETTESQTRGHVYALSVSSGASVRNLSVTVSEDSRMSGTYLYHGLFRGSHSWVSSSLADYAGTGGNTGNIVLWRGSDNGYWYFTDKNNPDFETVGALYTRHETDRPLDITETEWSDGESGTLTVTIADGGEGHPALNFTSEAMGKTIALYRKGTYNDRPRWESQDTVSGNFQYELVWDMSSWMLRSPVDDTYPESIVSDAASPLELSGQTWTSVCTLEEVSQGSGETTYAYEDITVTELDGLRSALAALEARVAALGG